MCVKGDTTGFDYSYKSLSHDDHYHDRDVDFDYNLGQSLVPDDLVDHHGSGVL